jgi:hypothetical protein
MDEIYSGEQIKIPPELPEILKNYAKFIIKNHPQDILKASCEYFQNLAQTTENLQDSQLAKFYRKVVDILTNSLIFTRKEPVQNKSSKPVF